MSAEILMIITLSIILLISPFISNFLKLPISLVEILLGMFAHSLGLLKEHHMLHLLAEVGFLYLMLLAGMEVNLKDLIKMDKLLFKKSFLFLILLYLLSAISVYIFHYTIIFIVILPLISIGLIMSIQQEIGKKEWLNLAIKIGVIGELVSILVLTIISGYFEFGLSKELVFNIGILFLFLIFLGFLFLLFRTLFWWYPKLKIILMPGSDKYFQDVRIAISLFFIMIAVMIILHLDVVLGAFIVGVFLATFFEHNKDLEHKLAPFGFGFLITIFFVNVGSSIDLKVLSLNLLKDAVILAILMLSLRIISAFVFFKELNKKTILLGLSLSMPLTLMIAVATLAYQNHTISNYWFSVFVVAAVVEVVVVMMSVKYLDKIS